MELSDIPIRGTVVEVGLRFARVQETGSTRLWFLRPQSLRVVILGEDRKPALGDRASWRLRWPPKVGAELMFSSRGEDPEDDRIDRAILQTDWQRIRAIEDIRQAESTASQDHEEEE